MQVFCGTGFFGESRAWLKQSVREIGARYSGHLIRGDVTHLVVQEEEVGTGESADNAEGQKVVKARQWGIKVVGRDWLSEVLRVRSLPGPRPQTPVDTVCHAGSTRGQEEVSPMDVSPKHATTSGKQDENTLPAEALRDEDGVHRQKDALIEASVSEASGALHDCKVVDDIADEEVGDDDDEVEEVAQDDCNSDPSGQEDDAPLHGHEDHEDEGEDEGQVQKEMEEAQDAAPQTPAGVSSAERDQAFVFHDDEICEMSVSPVQPQREKVRTCSLTGFVRLARVHTQDLIHA